MSLRLRCDTSTAPVPYEGRERDAGGSGRSPSGRAQPFADVVAENLDAVYRYLVYLTGDRVAAEDLAAETFEKAYRGWRRFDPHRGAPRTWLCRIAHSVAVDWFRAEARRQRREDNYMRDAEMLPRSPSSRDGLSPELDRALHRLTPAEREVVALRVLLELDGPSAARVLGISSDGVFDPAQPGFEAIRGGGRDVRS